MDNSNTIKSPEISQKLNPRKMAIGAAIRNIVMKFFEKEREWQENNNELFKRGDDANKFQERFKTPLINLFKSGYIDNIPETGLESILAIYRRILEISDRDFPRALELLDKYFYPKFANKSDREIYGQKHKEIYEDVITDIVNWVEQVKGHELYTIVSGMFGGKSTLAFEAIAQLENKGYKVFKCVGLPQQKLMSRNHPEKIECKGVTRETLNTSYSIGKDSEGNEIWSKSIKDQLIDFAKHNPYGLIYLDEFSFMEEDVLDEFIAFAKQLDLKVLQTGLSHDALNRPLKPASKYFNLRNSNKIYQCRSFVKNDNGKMVGKRTMRFFKLENSQYLPDFGACRHIVLEGQTPSIVYYPVREEDHPAEILEDSQELDSVWNIEFTAEAQNAFTERLIADDLQTAANLEEKFL